MKKKISLFVTTILLFVMMVMPVSAAELPIVSSDSDISVAATTGTNYFSKITTKLNSLNGSSSNISTLSSGTCSGTTQSITSVTAYARVSSGSSSFKLYVVSPDGTASYVSAGTSSSTYTFTSFNGKDPDGTWKVYIVSNGVVSTATVTLKVNYNYSF
jgi:hypothetical protein